MNFMTLMPYFILIVSAFFIGLAASVFIRKRGLLFSTNVMMIVVAFIFIPQIIRSVQHMSERPSLMNLMPLFMFGVVIAWFLYVVRGYMAFGVDGDDFQRALIETLREKNYDFEQSLSTIKIKNPEMEFSVAIQAWTGTAQIRLKGKTNRADFKQIMDGLKRREIKANYITPVMYAIIGVLISIPAFLIILK